MDNDVMIAWVLLVYDYSNCLMMVVFFFFFFIDLS